MARIVAFMYCENTRVSENGSLIVENPVLKISVPFIPTVYSLGIISGITDFDKSSEHTFKVLFRNPSNQILIESDNLKLPSPFTDKDSKENTGNLMLNFEYKNVEIREPGMYRTTIIFDGQ